MMPMKMMILNNNNKVDSSIKINNDNENNAVLCQKFILFQGYYYDKIKSYLHQQHSYLLQIMHTILMTMKMMIRQLIIIIIMLILLLKITMIMRIINTTNDAFFFLLHVQELN